MREAGLWRLRGGWNDPLLLLKEIWNYMDWGMTWYYVTMIAPMLPRAYDTLKSSHQPFRCQSAQYLGHLVDSSRVTEWTRLLATLNCVFVKVLAKGFGLMKYFIDMDHCCLQHGACLGDCWHFWQVNFLSRSFNWLTHSRIGTINNARCSNSRTVFSVNDFSFALLLPPCIIHWSHSSPEKGAEC